MKKCPQCGREYDNTMMFCLDDGAELLYGPALMDESATAILHSTAAPGEAPTRAQIDLTNETAILPADTGDVAKGKGFDKRLLLAPLVLAVIVLGGFFGYRYFNQSGSGAINSIAVMPFENRNSDADTDYLSDGLAESVIFRLTQLPDLRVSPTSSVMRYKGKETDVAKIASELGVDAVMTGRLTKRGDNLNITVELVDARTNKSLWGEQYERKLSELLTTQREMVAEIVSKLQLKLSGESEQKLAKKYTDNNEAYQLYLQGRFHWNKRDTKEFEKAIVFFNRAIEIDPNFALAYSGLADSLNLMPIFGDFRPKDFSPRAKQAALKALEVDPNLAEAHASLGRILYDYEYDFAGAEKSYKRAIELNPNYASAHQWYSDLLSVSSRHEEAVREITKAVELDPFSEIINWVMPEILRRAGRVEEANVRFTKLKELIPNESPRRYWVVFSDFLYNLTGKNVWEVEGQTSFATARVEPENFAKLKEAFEKGGWDRYWRMRQQLRIERLNSKQANDDPNAYVRAIDYAIAYALGKDKDKTIDYLNRAYDERTKYMLEINVDKTWDSVRDDPRFKELVKRVGIPE